MTKFIKRVFTSKANLIGSFVFWILSIVAFFAVAATSTGSETYTNWQQIALVIAIVIGIGSFLAFALFLFVQIYMRIRAWAVVLVILFLTIPAGITIYALGLNKANTSTPEPQFITSQPPTFTGQQLFDEVNSYRKENGVNELKLDPNLCGNLAQRYLDIKTGWDEGVAHKNFQEWYEEYVEPLGGYVIGEDFAWGKTPQDVIKEWDGSPGHRLSVLDPKNKVGCSYAAEGYGVLILGYRQNVAQKTVTQNTTPSRTGEIISYHEWCTNKDISIYENELITKKSSDGNVYTMTDGDWACYEDYLAKKR